MLIKNRVYNLSNSQGRPGPEGLKGEKGLMGPPGSRVRPK